jgi:ubiquinone/menaquinone biosynthesis C-methylase UbiE
MSDHETAGREPNTNRADWIRSLRRVNEQQEDSLADVFDARWGDIDDMHRTFVDEFLSRLPPGGRVLDAACGTGKYFEMVLSRGRLPVGVDHAGAYLEVARAKFPQVPTQRHDLQNLPYRDEFDGVMCIDAMEMVPPEDWPIVLACFHRALHRAGWMYLTIELVAREQVRALNEEARRSGLPVVAGEVFWKDEHGELYHFYPTKVWVRQWIAAAGFVVEKEAEGPWSDGYAYHHLLARAGAPTSRR